MAISLSEIFAAIRIFVSWMNDPLNPDELRAVCCPSSLKKEERYHFTVPFEYIVKRLGNDEYDVATTSMEVDIFWNEEDIGYDVSCRLPEADKIDPNEGNGDADEIYEQIISPIIRDTLTDMGFLPEAICARV